MIASEEEGRAEALRRIAACRETRGDELDLGGLQLTTIDGALLEALCQLGWLRRLFLGAGAEVRGRNLVFLPEEEKSKVCNTIGALPSALFDALTRLAQLDLSHNSLNCLPASIANLTTFTSLDLQSNSIGHAGAQTLKGLTALTSLHLADNAIRAEGAQSLRGLVNLTSLDLHSNGIGADGAKALKGLAALTVLNLSNNGIGDEGAQSLRCLVNLTSLNVSSNAIGAPGAQALEGLVNLTSLDLQSNSIGHAGAQSLKGLVNLTSLNLSNSNIGDEGARALEGLVNLTSLDLDGNAIGDAGAQSLKGLVNLTSLGLYANDIGDEGAQALGALVNLTSLNLQSNDIGAAGVLALKGLVNLTSLNLSYNLRGPAFWQPREGLVGLFNLTSLNLQNNDIGAAGAQLLKGLVNLTSLDLGGNSIGDAGAQALKGLVNLTSLNLSGNGIGNISPFASLSNLRSINLSGSYIDHDVPAFWMLPSLQEAILYDASLPGVPVEVLSNGLGDNCLDRLRAHLTDLTGEDVAVGDVKFMILGNGRVGKTQICRRLRGESFDETVPSTHGIQVSSLPLAPHVLDTPVTLKIWDFGGQDIYHGTHALFLKSRAIFSIVWTPKSEEEKFHTHAGFTFRNQPLAYWLAYVRTFGGPRSPVLVIQSQCDRPEDKRSPPLPRGALDAFENNEVLHYSAKLDRWRGTLDDELRYAVEWVRQSQSVAKIGPGRAAVKAEFEAKLAQGQRLIAFQSYIDLCAEVERAGKGRISDPELLLDYLHNIGTVFYRKGLFGDQIILDQAWALEAVYAVFDRASRSINKIERNRGRFRRSELAEWVWQQHGVPEQKLFLSFMQQCGICFTIIKEDREKRVEAEYIAPDLLPERGDGETEARLKLAWDEGKADAGAVLTFALLPPGLMRALIARIGSEAGLAAEYWRDGICFYDKETASRALVEQRWTEGWAGEVHIAAKRGQAGLLVQRLIELVQDDRISLGARPSGTKVTGVGLNAGVRDGPNAKADQTPVRPTHEPSTRLEYYVSYAWGDDTEEGKKREGTVDRLCTEADARGLKIVRDKSAMKIGDRISTFMDRVGKGAVNGRVFIVLSDKYLKSGYCMHELFDVWRNCRADPEIFMDRTRVLVLPSAKISTPEDRAEYVIHWQKRYKRLDALVRKHGSLVLSDTDNAEFRLMSLFVSYTANFLQLMQDTLRPRSFDEFVNYVFD
jgi:internalin A